MKQKDMNDFDDEERQMVLDFENTVMKGKHQFFDVDELEVIIDYYLEVGDLEPLERAVEYAEELYPGHTEVELRRAHLLIVKQQYDEAMRIIKRLRTREPENTDIIYTLGVAYGAMGKSHQAIRCYLEAAKDGWQLGRIYSNIAEEYYNMHDYDNAIRYYHLALDTDSFDTSTIYNYVDTAQQSSRAEEAVSYMKSFVDEHPYSAEGWHCLGIAYATLGMHERAIDAYEFALAIDKNLQQAYQDMADSLEALGRLGEAVSSLLRGAEGVEDISYVYLEIAHLYDRHSLYPTALSYYRKAVDQNPANAEALADMAVLTATMGDISQGMELAKRALRLKPDSAAPLFAAARISEMKGNTEQAWDYYDRMLDCDDCNDSQCAQYVIFLYENNEFDNVIDFSLDSLKFFPHHPIYSTYLVASYYYTNRYNSANRYLADVMPGLLQQICPDIFEDAHFAGLIPSNDDSMEKKIF